MYSRFQSTLLSPSSPSSSSSSSSSSSGGKSRREGEGWDQYGLGRARTVGQLREAWGWGDDNDGLRCYLDEVPPVSPPPPPSSSSSSGGEEGGTGKRMPPWWQRCDGDDDGGGGGCDPRSGDFRDGVWRSNRGVLPKSASSSASAEGEGEVQEGPNGGWWDQHQQRLPSDRQRLTTAQRQLPPPSPPSSGLFHLWPFSPSSSSWVPYWILGLALWSLLFCLSGRKGYKGRHKPRHGYDRNSKYYKAKVDPTQAMKIV